jgi:hypothetical protein
MKNLTMKNNFSLVLFFLVFTMAHGQSVNGHEAPHKNYSELEQDYSQCEKITGEAKDKESCFRNLYRECSKTANYFRFKYGLRSNNAPKEFDKVLALRLKLQSKLSQSK